MLYFYDEWKSLGGGGAGVESRGKDRLQQVMTLHCLQGSKDIGYGYETGLVDGRRALLLRQSAALPVARPWSWLELLR